MSKSNCHQRPGICDGRIIAFRHADTEVDFCFIVEDNICCLIINVKPELKLIKDLLPVAPMSSPAIAKHLCKSGSLRVTKIRRKMQTQTTAVIPKLFIGMDVHKKSWTVHL